MNRRHFLRLKTEHGIRTLELSCRRLHLHYVERRVTGGRLDTDDPLDQDFDPTENGEPPTAFEARTTEQLFEHLGRDLDDVDLLRVTEHRWLSEGDEELRREFNRLLSSFRARGGRVEFG